MYMYILEYLSSPFQSSNYSVDTDEEMYFKMSTFKMTYFEHTHSWKRLPQIQKQRRFSASVIYYFIKRWVWATLYFVPDFTYAAVFNPGLLFFHDQALWLSLNSHFQEVFPSWDKELQLCASTCLTPRNKRCHIVNEFDTEFHEMSANNLSGDKVKGFMHERHHHKFTSDTYLLVIVRTAWQLLVTMWILWTQLKSISLSRVSPWMNF